MNPETVFVAPPSRMANPSRLLIENATKSSILLVLILFDFFDSCTITLEVEHYTTQSIGTKCTFFQVRKQSVSHCWDILKHDVPPVDTACTDQDGDEEHELYQLQSDAFWTSEDETRHVSSVFLAEGQVYPNLSVFHLSEKRTFLSSCPSCLCHETLQVFDQWMAEPSHQKHRCQQLENSVWHS